MARLLGVGRSTLTRWEAGGEVPLRCWSWLEALDLATRHANEQRLDLVGFTGGPTEGSASYWWHKALLLAFDPKGEEVQSYRKWLEIRR